ncbi:hypothetical protein SAICODRAFT_20593 [Saitoella complicata NRRL Y-17804]|uniref:Nuclear rim protein 1 n=1 Tax=Saitoella complicata (strain BCRC 22490 / CBS 7301 / JCM 7358 / NBRC 10748 / NRRL Y-17804) TaxID=698492 RepID=A0A0E9NC72_SAICN|nr:uncharacterized protein SAICODRAFT_20593 [Saitoella complicata NRRL Y-17804]ODQ51574.1 hypothetical protein SAICODRAFT_20593 [Saitoella complicata NRRL Y-17804]GAO47326.1 hypothetical protein G7K_1534-t1 [Saitoella complicata NRRL Y-17804]
MPPTRRLVRRAPLYKRVLSAPKDWVLSFGEEWDTIEWEAFEKSTSLPAGIAANVVLAGCRLWKALQSKWDGNGDVFARPGSRGYGGAKGGVFTNETAKGLFGSTLSLIAVMLVALSILNTLYCFFRTREYRLFQKDAESETGPSTPSARRVRIETSPSRLHSLIASYLNPQPSIHPDSDRDVWQLSIWNPTTFSLRFFCTFSPASAVMLFNLTPANFFWTLVVSAGVGAQLWVLMGWHERQGRDKQVVFGEVMNEYEVKFVQPRLSVVKRDVATQASGVDAETSTVEVEVHTPQLIKMTTAMSTQAHTGPVLPGSIRHSLPGQAVGPSPVKLAPRMSMPAPNSYAGPDAMGSPRRPVSPSKSMGSLRPAGYQASPMRPQRPGSGTPQRPGSSGQGLFAKQPWLERDQGGSAGFPASPLRKRF